MSSDVVLTLLNNVALLLAMGVVYDAISFRRQLPQMVQSLLLGTLIGFMGVIIMSLPLSLVSGVIIDARSILLSVAAFFFGLIPTIIAVVATLAFRIFEGGQGVFAGILIILSSAGIGLCYRYLHRQRGHIVNVSAYQLYFLGVLVHLAMLLALLSLPQAAIDSVISEVAFPVMLIYPLGTVILGMLLSHQLQRRITERALRKSEREHRISRQHLEATFAAIPDLLFEMDINGHYHACHAHSAKAADLAAPIDELIGSSVFDVMPYESAAKVIDALHEADEKGVSRGVQIRLRLEHGERVFELSVSRKSSLSEQARFIVLSRDVTERKQAEQELHIAATAFDSQEGMLITDHQFKILRVNNAFTRVTGYSAEEAIGNTPAMLSSGQHDVLFYQKMQQRLKEERYWQGEIWNRRKSGEIYPQYLTITAVQTDGGKVTNYVGAFTDITQRKKDEADIHKLAFYDSLTGLPNRRSLQERLDSGVKACHITEQRGAVLFIDLDNFKKLNDTQGHDCGDQLLVQVAKRLSRCVRNADMVARLGGDEFVIILENLGTDESTVLTQVNQIVSKVVSALHQSYILRGQPYHSSCSVGVALFAAGDRADDIMKRSDMAMYQAKESGKNTFRFFDPDAERTLCTLTELENDLRRALPNKQLEVFFQAQFRDHKLIGAETLLRWCHPERGMVSPAEFIPLAEDTGLIEPIGDWVLRKACKQLSEWQDNPLTQHLTLSVNVSARQFGQQDFVAEVKNCISIYQIDPNLLKIELTESLVLMDIEDTIRKMCALREIGIRFSLDDFGTGYSSLLHLKRLPLDQIKIDQSFIRDITTDPDDAEIVQTIIAMGHNLRLNVIAEGVEDQAQQQFLESKNCCTYQGYLFGRPEPIADFEQHYLSEAALGRA